MKKADLKTGMLVQYRNGKVGMVINNFILTDGYIEIGNIEYDLRHERLKEYDIMKVSNVLTYYKLMPSYWTEETLNNNLLWEREEKPTELTIQQIEEMTGLKNIKIVK